MGDDGIVTSIPCGQLLRWGLAVVVIIGIIIGFSVLRADVVGAPTVLLLGGGLALVLGVVVEVLELRLVVGIVRVVVVVVVQLLL